jgi:hypothetical protein
MSNELTKPPSTELISRDNLGKFVAGVSGNPAGRPRGSKNRTVIMKQAMEEALTREVSGEFLAILQTAINLALGGDKDMIKLVLNDFMKEVRRADVGDGDDGGPKTIEISISQYFGPDADKKAVANAVDAEFTDITAKTGLNKPT